MEEPRLEVIVGPMFAGKSTELIKRIRLYQVAGFETIVFKPKLDNRYCEGHITSHDQEKIPAINIENSDEISKYLNNTNPIIGIDEVQFLDSNIITFCNDYVNNGGIIITSGLSKDYRDEWFPFSDGIKNISDLMQTADKLTFLKAICTHQFPNGKLCGKLKATRSQRFVNGNIAPYDGKLIEVGGQEAYAPRCREHFQFYKNS